MTDFDSGIVAAFRAGGGRVEGVLGGAPMLLLHHVGARSGRERITPLAYFPRADGSFAIVASNGGASRHPGWYHNLRANPDVTVEVGADTVPVRAEVLTGAAREPLWSTLLSLSPALAGFTRRTDRVIPLVVLHRLGA
ncbi:nitroreductase family deazaflavin-dependent oxidoreductase [Nocardia sp. alder85J]|uniref:nitroreductase family deazaflavin-dependent oxidoreductase n=1 Tax=Nocardia sp. alder85J TaxID=2862949 RepID=UPI001CD4F623|nr:nitroreductase family deazaflavin-dependent oxidoreductase [Nocardia sp. alder85J]MCX4092962.1 nitroreductase family deazaflavin-dependent oxidoreductase [Nocardia sp. alder85J]